MIREIRISTQNTILIEMKGKQKPKGKVIAMPEDRTYSQGFRADKREETEDSSYMSNKAESALRKLRAMGD